MKKYIEIVADTNDADYITSVSEIDNETIENIKPVIEAIKQFKPYEGRKNWSHHHNFPASEYRRDDLGEKSPFEMYGELDGFEDFEELVPYGENGIHTIKSIRIFEVVNEEKLL